MCNGLLGIIIFTKGFTSITCTDFQQRSTEKNFPLNKGNKEGKEKKINGKYSWIFNELSERGNRFSRLLILSIMQFCYSTFWTMRGRKKQVGNESVNKFEAISRSFLLKLLAWIVLIEPAFSNFLLPHSHDKWSF